MTYNVFGGTLNLAQSINSVISEIQFLNAHDILRRLLRSVVRS